MAKSLIFIPDISGFTGFVKETEIQHSHHIIKELLELLIDSNQIGLKLSEIEGDAILFYKDDKIPGFNNILEQSKNMFLNFHDHLINYEHRRICHCGACSTASRLSLKIVVHQGEIEKMMVKNRENLYGNDVILAHKLLKNDVPGKEYLLLSDALKADSEEIDSEQFNWVTVLSGDSEYENLGVVSYQYIPFDPLQEFVQLPMPMQMPEKTTNPVEVEKYIDLPTDQLYELVSNLKIKESWVKGVDRLEFKRDRVNRVGDTHICVIDKKDFEFETVSNDFGKDKLVYGERLFNFSVFKEMSTYFVIGENGKGSDLCIQVHYIIKPIMGFLMKPFVRKRMEKAVNTTIDNIEEYLAESGYKL